jgi:hypothetical protein
MQAFAPVLRWVSGAGLDAGAIAVSAALLFWVQPMVARALLPVAGGAPGVWNTCLLFFQASLLAGYLYAHFLSRRVRARLHAVCHVTLLAIAVLALPATLSADTSDTEATLGNPTVWLLATLGLWVGVPALALAATSPLLQWHYARATGERDPYFLYAASNAGSLFALLTYPALVEPWLGLSQQVGWWKTAFAGWAVLVIAALFRARAQTGATREPVAAGTAETRVGGRKTPVAANVFISRRQRWRWMALAFAPSCLMQGVTTYVATEVAAAPLFWILPLGIYLGTFVMAFARTPRVPLAWLLRAVPAAACALAFLILSEAADPAWLMIATHLAGFGLVALACHRELAEARPEAEQVTGFYFWVALGGVLGGVFCALIAPLAFRHVAEYPIALVLACWLVHSNRTATRTPRAWLADIAVAVGIGLSVAALSRWLTLPAAWGNAGRGAIVYGIPLMLGFCASDRRERFAGVLAAVFVAWAASPGAHGRTIHADRSFFGIHRVTIDSDRRLHRFLHGNTLHGQQFLDAARRCEALAYYHAAGPLGDVFRIGLTNRPPAHVAVVGLGIGSSAAFALPGQNWTFYEIDPAVERLARNPNLFTFLRDCAPGTVSVVLGDARLRLREAADSHYGLILLDAFSSDAIPAHLLTREALRLYLSKLAANGLLAFHISNRNLDLQPVVAALAADAGLICRVADFDPGASERSNGCESSTWVLMARNLGDLGALARNTVWLPPEGPRRPPWTDERSNVLGAIRWW